jgi:squalene synthase HpnC
VDPVEKYLRPLPPAAALAEARRLAAGHYENFAVSSRFIPRPLRDDFARLYAFCRATDDLGDEGAGDREPRLLCWRDDWRRAQSDAPGELPWPLFCAASLRRERRLPAGLFDDLISANLQDQRVARYSDWQALEGYTRLSANPVGRLVLRLFGVDDPESDRLSDAICTGLQYANFWQDVGVDFRKGRIYLPESEWRAGGLSDADFGGVAAPAALREILHDAALPRAEKLFDEGEALRGRVPAALRRQLTLYIGGGRAILKALRRQDCDPLRHRPTVGKAGKALLLVKALLG